MKGALSFIRPFSNAEVKNKTTKAKQKQNKRKQNKLRGSIYIYLLSKWLFFLKHQAFEVTGVSQRFKKCADPSKRWEKIAVVLSLVHELSWYHVQNLSKCNLKNNCFPVWPGWIEFSICCSKLCTIPSRMKSLD